MFDCCFVSPFFLQVSRTPTALKEARMKKKKLLCVAKRSHCSFSFTITYQYDWGMRLLLYLTANVILYWENYEWASMCFMVVNSQQKIQILWENQTLFGGKYQRREFYCIILFWNRCGFQSSYLSYSISTGTVCTLLCVYSTSTVPIQYGQGLSKTRYPSYGIRRHVLDDVMCDTLMSNPSPQHHIFVTISPSTTTTR
jgi:hypothetical protein